MMEQTTDIVVRAKEGDTYAYEELYKLTKNKAYYLAVQVLKNPHDAEDVLQDAYLIAFSKIEDAISEKFQGWLDTIVINRAKDLLKKKKPIIFNERQSEEAKDYVPELEEERIEFLPEENMDFQETKRIVQEIIDELPEEQRISIIFYYYNEMSVADIASYFECSDGTIKSRLNYARKAIKTKVEDLEKRGIKLYSISVLPFLHWMLQSEAEKAVFDSENLLQIIRKSAELYHAAGETVQDASDSVIKDLTRSGTKKVIGGKVTAMSIGTKVGIVAIIATVGITGGILIHQRATPQPPKIDAMKLTEELGSSDEKNVENTPKQAPTAAAIEPIEQEETFALAGTFNRTNVNSGEGGVMEITNLDEEGFDFSINVACGGNIGNAEGHAVMDNDSEATSKIDLYDGTYATFHFKVVDEQVEVETENTGFLGGIGTYFYGTYMKGEPVYLNENVVEEILGNNKDDVMNLLGEDFETLTLVMKEGTSYETDLTYSGFISGVGDGADLWIMEDGRIYCLIYEAPNEYRFYTNDANYRRKIPSEFGQKREGDIKFIYVEPTK